MYVPEQISTRLLLTNLYVITQLILIINHKINERTQINDL